MTMQSRVEDRTKRLYAARDEAEEDLLSDVAFAQSLAAGSGTEGFGYENIVGVGLGERLSMGRPTGERAVTVYVVHKAPLDRIESSARVPERYGGVVTDIVESGEFVAYTGRGRYRPAPSGVSLAHHNDTAGTLGFVARYEDQLVVVSNNHVLALENDARKGDAILQPGPADGGTATDVLAEFIACHPLDFNGPNLIDAACAQVSRDDVSDEIYGIGTFVAAPLEPSPNMLVRKCGRTSGISRGIVRDVDASLKVRYGNRVVRLREQVIVDPRDDRPFSEPGDSGSLVIDEVSRHPVGLLCGGSPKYTIANRIERVLDGLGVSLSV
jgi:hypothetical protein